MVSVVGDESGTVDDQLGRHHQHLPEVAHMYESSSYAVGWGALALINANLAQLKGRSGLGWFLGSLLGGPIATLLLAVLSRADAA
jgi:hypothetical protein